MPTKTKVKYDPEFLRKLDAFTKGLKEKLNNPVITDREWYQGPGDGYGTRYHIKIGEDVLVFFYEFDPVNNSISMTPIEDEHKIANPFLKELVDRSDIVMSLPELLLEEMEDLSFIDENLNEVVEIGEEIIDMSDEFFDQCKDHHESNKAMKEIRSATLKVLKPKEWKDR